MIMCGFDGAHKCQCLFLKVLYIWGIWYKLGIMVLNLERDKC